jgi:hypothetical protein
MVALVTLKNHGRHANLGPESAPTPPPGLEHLTPEVVEQGKRNGFNAGSTKPANPPVLSPGVEAANASTPAATQNAAAEMKAKIKK